jgi:ABC-type uncharacterized transport system YnjBCD permease subunit
VRTIEKRGAKNGKQALLRSICAELPVRLLSVPRRGFAFSMIEVYAECGVLRRTVSNAPSNESSTDSHTLSIGVHAIVVIVEGEAIAVVRNMFNTIAVAVSI